MGAQISKNAGKEEAAVEKPAEGAAVAAKANGQVRENFGVCSLAFLSRPWQRVAPMACSMFPRSIPTTLAGVQGKWPHVSTRHEPFVPLVHY